MGNRRQADAQPQEVQTEQGQPQPPNAPGITRRFQLYGYQYVAIPVLLLIPVLALFGVFGPTTGIVEARDNDVALVVEFPDRAHYQAYSRIRVIVRNAGGSALSGVTVEIERGLFEHVSQVSFNPSLADITGEAYVVDLGDLPPDAERIVTVDFQPDRNGSNAGTVSVVAGGEPLVQTEITMFVFP